MVRRDFDAVYQDVDALVSPTSPSIAFEFGDKSDPLTMYKCDVCTIPSNLGGDPAMSVPFGTGDHSMPVGVQVLAPPNGEQMMFRVAAAVERAAP